MYGWSLFFFFIALSRSRSHYKAGEPDGLGETYFENGQLKSKVNYKAGVPID